MFLVNNAQNSLIISNNRLVTVNDISDMAIVETPDAVFISRLSTSRNVKDIVSTLKQQGRRECHMNLLETYSWGHLQYPEKSKDLVVAKLIIKPHTSYCMQSDGSNRLHVNLLTGEAHITHNRAKYGLQAGHSFALDVQSQVTIKNTSNNDLIAIITYLEEE